MRSRDGVQALVAVGGHAVCGLMTTWGDGLFPATLDVDESDKPLRCTITFATEQSLEASA